MDKKQAHYLATLAAKETFKRTFQKLAQQQDPSPVQPIMEGHEKRNVEKTDHDGGASQERSGDLGGYEPANRGSLNTSLEGGLFADDEGKCPKCDCDSEKKDKKEASATSSLMRIAAAYAKAAK